MPPSRPMDAPVAMLMIAEKVLTSSVRNGSRPSPATTTSSRLVEPCGPTRRSPPCSTSPAASPPKAGNKIRSQSDKRSRRQPAQGREQNPFPIGQTFRNFHRVAGVDQVDRVKEKQVHQTADDADAAGQHEVKRIFVEREFFAPLQCGPPMAAKKFLRLRNQPAFHPRLHG